MSAPSPDTRRRHDWLPSRRALLVACVAFVVGLLAFLALWLDHRSSNDFYRPEPGLPTTVSGQQFEPLPAPLPAGADGHVAAPEDEADESPERAENPFSGGAEAPDSQVAAQPPPREIAPPPPSGPTSLPRPIQQPAPDYPRDAFRRRESGTVLLRVHVGADGDPHDIDLISSSGSRSLDRAAIDAVRRWRFAPAMRGETPVEGIVQVPIEFALAR